jgi:hypothetical protein
MTLFDRRHEIATLGKCERCRVNGLVSRARVEDVGSGIITLLLCRSCRDRATMTDTIRRGYSIP